MSHKTPQIADALALHQKGQLDAAMLMYDEILKSNPKHGDALHLRGLIAFQQGDLNSADQDIRKAIAVKPKEVNYHTNLGRVLNKARNFESAAVSFRNALKLTSDVADTHSDLAAALIHLGDLSDAIGKSVV